MVKHSEQLRPIGQLVTTHDLTTREGSFALSYGSSVLGSPTSDFDLLIVTYERLPKSAQDQFINDLITLHHDTNRTLDEEVPYDTKLFYTHEEVGESLTLPFIRPVEPGKIDVRYLDQMHEDDTYFESPEMKQRLVFNALTSPHEFLAGDAQIYRRFLVLARQSLTKLVRHLREGDPRDISDILGVSPDGITGKDYLGYNIPRVRPHLLVE